MSPENGAGPRDGAAAQNDKATQAWDEFLRADIIEEPGVAYAAALLGPDGRYLHTASASAGDDGSGYFRQEDAAAARSVRDAARGGPPVAEPFALSGRRVTIGPIAGDADLWATPLICERTGLNVGVMGGTPRGYVVVALCHPMSDDIPVPGVYGAEISTWSVFQSRIGLALLTA
ncbi:hypothetical protein G3I60_34630 [Streptomyces sp. SID13666]|uniref:hypothetical protein n=1 Tax=unclassified Streptomyces TaxID=2593676 RepID=UPI0013BED6FF|nr:MULTISPECIES: hypothetical protein [unclassified Streptomyces]NEA59160.1 hypothetical protein [Streptomyces sp. SID13666]NEA75337.1 hypothetical protein [Streptomyces sp. SID13588]